VPESQIVETLIEEAMRLASEMSTATGSETDHGPGTTTSGSPVVTVS
jgi:(E)-4-hydroxy-3-methylbut-2-enyl-diphosphate synthase